MRCSCHFQFDRRGLAELVVVVEHAARVSFLVSHRSFNHCLTRLDSEVPHSREFPAKGRRRMDEDSRNFKPPHPCIATRRSENEDRDRRVSNGRDQVAQSPVRAIAVIDAPIRPVCREQAIRRASLWLAHFPTGITSKLESDSTFFGPL